MKLCPKCSIEKPLTEFYNRKASPDGKGHICKRCHNSHVLDWYHKHPERRRAISAANEAKKGKPRKRIWCPHCEKTFDLWGPKAARTIPDIKQITQPASDTPQPLTP